MKELEIGDVIPIYEIVSDSGYSGLKGDNFIPQQRPQNVGKSVGYLKELANVVYFSSTEDPIVLTGLFSDSEIKPIGQMRIKKLK